jgi:hypothetical protein
LNTASGGGCDFGAPIGSRIGLADRLASDQYPANGLHHNSREDVPMPDQPTAEAPLSFGSDIQPLFREKDRTSMLRAFDLWSRDDVVAHGPAIVAALKKGSMPCDERWPDDRVSTLERWLGDGAAP